MLCLQHSYLMSAAGVVQVLHDAFFKHQTKPSLTPMGDLYYEGKEFEARVRACALTTCCPALLVALACRGICLT